MSTSQEHGNVSIDNLPPPSPKKLKKLRAVAVGIVAVLFVGGLVPRLLSYSRSSADAQALINTLPHVDVALPKRAPTEGALSLPGDATALQSTALFPRTTGYMKKLLVDIGDKVVAGQLLAEIDSPEIDAQLNQAKGALAKDESDFGLARDTLRRYEQFAKSGGVTRQQLDEKQSAFAQAQAALDSAKAEVERLSALQGFEKIVAPFPGVIVTRNYDVGALLSPTTAADKELFRIDRVDTIRVFVNVPQSYVGDIKGGQPATFSVRNYPGKEFVGSVTRTSGSLDTGTRTLRVQIEFPNLDGSLYAGMYGQVKIPLTKVQPLTVPTSALQFDAEGLRVATVVEGKVHFKKVTVGRDFGTEIEVLSGIEGSEQVITNPGQRIIEGVGVQIIAAPSPSSSPVKSKG